jgi:rhamnogalacturonyl hydrolase YesR
LYGGERSDGILGVWWRRGRFSAPQLLLLLMLATKARSCDLIHESFLALVPPLLHFADQETGAWYQLTTLPGAEGNFLESSSTVLFTWALLKAIRLDLLLIQKNTRIYIRTYTPPRHHHLPPLLWRQLASLKTPSKPP